LKQNLGPDVEVSLIAGSNGVYEIVADNRLVFSKKSSGRFPGEGEIVRLLKGQ